MDNLGWSTIEGRFGVSNPNILCPYAVNNDLAEDIFNPIQELQRTSPENAVSNLNSSQLQDTRLAADWKEAAALTSAEFCSSPLNPLGSMAEFVDSFQDCMLSASNSNTDTSVEDDEISMIFRNKEMKCPVNHETVSQNSSECYVVNNENFQENRPKGKKPRLENPPKTSSNINFQIQQPGSSASSSMEEPDPEAMAQMKEMIYRAAAFRPVNSGMEMVENYKPKMRKNVRISSDPQTVAARQRRERISERIRVLQRLVPGGNKMDTATMLDEAASYLKFLRSQVKALENLGHNLVCPPVTTSFGFSSLPFHHSFPMQTHFSLVQNPNHTHHPQC